MSAIHSIRTYSDAALAGAIRQLTLSDQWAQRLSMLLKEQTRRRKHGICIPQENLLPL